MDKLDVYKFKVDISFCLPAKYDFWQTMGGLCFDQKKKWADYVSTKKEWAAYVLFSLIGCKATFHLVENIY